LAHGAAWEIKTADQQYARWIRPAPSVNLNLNPTKESTMNLSKAVKRMRDGRMQKGTKQSRRPKEVSDAALEALANGVTNSRDRAIIWMLIETGLRGGEIVALDQKKVSLNADGSGGSGEFTQTKSATGRMFCFGRRTAQALHEYLATKRADDCSDAFFVGHSGKRLTVPQLSNMVRRWCAQLRIERIALHQFRRNFARRFSRGGGSPAALAGLLGHKNCTTTIRMFFKPSESAISQEYSRAMGTASTSSSAR
jgi:site-specific recombinase XerC